MSLKGGIIALNGPLKATSDMRASFHKCHRIDDLEPEEVDQSIERFRKRVDEKQPEAVEPKGVFLKILLFVFYGSLVTGVAFAILCLRALSMIGPHRYGSSDKSLIDR